jgi:hypothetical protein
MLRGALSLREEVRVRRTRGVQISSHTILKTWLSWLKVNLLRFAIKQMSHQRGSGNLPRGTWPRDMIKGICQWHGREGRDNYVVPLSVRLGFPRCLVTLGSYPAASRQLSTFGLSSRLIASAFVPR